MLTAKYTSMCFLVLLWFSYPSHPV